MTLPYERLRAAREAEHFLMDLCDPRETPKVPLAVRERAKRVLKHYPQNWDWHRVTRMAPAVFSEDPE